ncbi:MAG: polyphosphate kinase 2 family protein [Chloroflexota bacterium]|nr:polyphosphate kinase 2 family protein [Chloroflexota bacterium]
MGYATRVTGERPVRLDEIDTGATVGLDQETADRRLAELTTELRDLQDLLYAAESQAVLVVLQGMDAAGKDVTIANVFDATNPQSCRVVALKPRTEAEEAHDFLWRAHAVMPALGEMVILDRSYYEQVVSERVTGKVSVDVVRWRFRHVNAFEELLTDDGKTIVLKFFLHLGQAEQGRRLEEREADPESAWKISARDWQSRESWDDYMASYEEAINACASKEAPWYVVPSDHQWFHNLAVAEAIVDRLRPHGDEWRAARDRQGEEKRAEARAARGA